jgi:hypothetical protein
MYLENSNLKKYEFLELNFTANKVMKIVFQSFPDDFS